MHEQSRPEDSGRLESHGRRVDVLGHHDNDKAWSQHQKRTGDPAKGKPGGI
jgi:hypothetical protein